MILYLIRHGETVAHVNGIMQLFHSELHEESIRILEDKKDFNHINFNKVYTSPQHRAIQTAKILFKNQEIEVLDNIYEFVPPAILNGQPRNVGAKFWIDHREEIYKPDWNLDGSESFNDILARVQEFIVFIRSKHTNKDTIAVVGHGIFFKHTIGYLLAKERYSPHIFSDFIRLIELKNGGYFILNLDIVSNNNRLLSLNN